MLDPEAWPHYDHSARRGPYVGEYHFACIDCRVYGVTGYWQWVHLEEWAEQDYYDNIEWIEGPNA